MPKQSDYHNNIFWKSRMNIIPVLLGFCCPILCRTIKIPFESICHQIQLCCLLLPLKTKLRRHTNNSLIVCQLDSCGRKRARDTSEGSTMDFCDLNTNTSNYLFRSQLTCHACELKAALIRRLANPD